jgi:hypothetical protein
MKRLLAVTVCALILAGSSCGKDGTGSGAGELSVRLTSPNSGADSAIVFTISGPTALTSATAGAGLRLFQQPLGNTTTRFALTGRLTTSTTILTIGVADVDAVAQYTGSIEGVAQPNYVLRTLPGNYLLTVIR